MTPVLVSIVIPTGVEGSGCTMSPPSVKLNRMKPAIATAAITPNRTVPTTSTALFIASRRPLRSQRRERCYALSTGGKNDSLGGLERIGIQMERFDAQSGGLTQDHHR